MKTYETVSVERKRETDTLCDICGESIHLLNKDGYDFQDDAEMTYTVFEYGYGDSYPYKDKNGYMPHDKIVMDKEFHFCGPCVREHLFPHIIGGLAPKVNPKENK